MKQALVPGASDLPLRRLVEAQGPAGHGPRTGGVDQYRDAIIMMKKQESPSRLPTGRAAASGWQVHWGWVLALTLGLGLLALFGLLDLRGANADGILHAHASGTFHVSLLLLVAALALAFMDFIFGRAKGR